MVIRLFVLLVLCTIRIQAQSFSDSIAQYRANYKAEFLKDDHSPLKAADTGFLRFYPADANFRVFAVFTPTKDSTGFDMMTHSGQKRRYFVYGTLQFNLKDHFCRLFIYQSEKLKSKKGFEDYLFVPFKDETNYTTTFGGGRYLDFKMSDIQQGILELDFNKAYNPYCAYQNGFHCPIPPRENELFFKIEAGEMLFGRAIDEGH
ncbi:MAG: DUF1684 domain-containing protein [Chitinophagaceae bacterium]|nr:DUF1684 domain-containing protein [Chitinophagaceae bacterium]